MADGNNLTPERAAELNALTAKQIAQKKEIGDLNAKDLAYLNKKEEIEKRLGTYSATTIKELARQGELYAKLGDSYDARVLQAEHEVTIQEKSLANAQKLVAEGKIQGKDALELLRSREEELATAKHQVDVLKNQTEAIKEGRAAAVELGEALGALLINMESTSSLILRIWASWPRHSKVATSPWFRS